MSDDGLDLDAELLALAGDEVGSDQEIDDARHSPRISRSPTPRSSPQPSDRHSSPEQSPPRRKVKSRKAGGRRRKDDSEEEGEASSAPGSPDSLGSGAMEESDSDAAMGDINEDSNPYPVEGKFISWEDKTRIMGLSEVERESILAERAQEIERRNQDLNLKRLLETRKAKEEKKRKAGVADLDDGERKISRPKTKATNEKLEAYKRVREQAHDQRSRRNRDRRSPSVSSDRARSDIDAEGESDVEWDSHKRSPVKEEPPAELKDFERVRVGRSNFAKVCFYPGFEDALIGCFARVSIGMDKGTGQGVYRMCQIKGFTEGSPYTMQGSNNKPVKTDLYVLVAHGKAEKEWPFIMCSDSKFSESEFQRWKSVCEGEGVKIPSRSKLNRNLESIHALLDRRWSEEEIAEKLRRQNKFAPERSGNVVPVTAVSSRNSKLQDLNRNIRKNNANEVRQALLAERAARAAAAEKARLRRAEEEIKKRAAEDAKADALFDGSDISRTGTPSNQTKKPKVERKGIPTFTKKAMDDELIGSMDLGIDIEI
ncbi:putative rna polymerase ii transcription elongation factor protein [Neofusicoccum parvum UCRNP2]|uniref:Putative rna polymerase ii transcription elongation factor protein n=1 Tax=Botryosphaeria parva (strain UCR-NP2) TaxID=1287680 RepID=R1EUI8_BOTPV|nr:putative rna polymerase ii transcription elongation factor protein [Neofusicoccum parvum UCRNP2]